MASNVRFVDTFPTMKPKDKKPGEERLNLLMVDPHIPAGAKLY